MSNFMTHPVACLSAAQLGLASEIAAGMWELLVAKCKEMTMAFSRLERLLLDEVNRVFTDPSYDALCIPTSLLGRQSFLDHVVRSVMQKRFQNRGKERVGRIDGDALVLWP
jgi:pyruvate/oxaloacetate carboxyltransferase